MLRVTRPPRVPTLHRLICAGLEDFLSDRSDDPRLEGLVPRSSLTPWWQAAKLLAGSEIEALEARLREQLAAPAPNLETLQQEAQEAAARWSAAIIAELAKPKPPLALRKLVPELIARDVDMIAHMLNVARPLARRDEIAAPRGGSARPDRGAAAHRSRARLRDDVEAAISGALPRATAWTRAFCRWRR